MSDGGPNSRLRLKTLRVDVDRQVDTIRLARLDALERRAAAQTGAVRQLLDARLAELLAAVERETAYPGGGVDAEKPARPPSALKDLIQQLDRDGVNRDATASIGRPSSHQRTRQAAFEDVRQACAQIRNRSQLRQALASAPADAGPLNSASLVHRALARMHELSPEYVQHFLAYVDALSSLQPLCGSAAKPAESGPRPAGAGRRSRAKPRNPKP